MSSDQRRAGQRAGLTHDVILGAAVAIADEDGLDALTMRHLAARLDVAPNALYSYFADKDELLDALLDELLGTIASERSLSGDWREGLVELMDASRGLLLAHPRLVSMFLTRPSRGLNAARLGEQTFTLLRHGGIEGAPAVEAFRNLLIYTLGFAAFQAPRRQPDAEDRSERGRAAFASLPPAEFPEMLRVAEHLALPPTDVTFRTGLGWLLDGIERAAVSDGRGRSRRSAPH